MDRAPAAALSQRPVTVRGMLRAATQAAHERMHAHPRLVHLAAGSIGRAAYADLLRDFLEFHHLVEDRLARGADLAPLGIDLSRWRRSPQLLDDLAALGLGAPAEGRACDLPVPASVPAALGYLYVTEGSRLGGRVLAKALDPAWLPHPDEGRSFLRSDAQQHRLDWISLCAAIEHAGHSAAARAAMIEAALAAFQAFEHALAQGSAWRGGGAMAAGGVRRSPAR